MRLSTDPHRDDERSIAIIHAALDAGATLLDTADAYALDETDIGHNERLVARALATWSGDRSHIVVATKGGIRRPKGAWVSDAKAKSLRDACDASREALGVDAIDLYQLHAVDPKTSIETSMRALAKLERDGAIKSIGLCNVTVGQIEIARAIAEVASVQVSLSAVDDENIRNGVAEYCRDEGIRLIAHRPLGGVDKVMRLHRDTMVSDIANRHSVTPQEVVLAWLMSLGVVPIPGATRIETAISIGRARTLELTDGDRQRLDDRFAGGLVRVSRAERRPRSGAEGDVVLVMGMPGAGKTTVARDLEAQGYERLNRDVLGGSLADLVPRLDHALANGAKRVVLDNTYPSRSSRNAVIETAWHRGVPARCIWVATELPDAQINAIVRMIEAHGSLPSPEEIRAKQKDDPRYLGPDALFRYERTVEPPVEDEGFESIERRPFARFPFASNGAPALILDFDDILNDFDLISRYAADGWTIFAHAWRPQIARRELTAEQMDATFAMAREQLGVEAHFALCPHDAGPPICWCRKPLPGRVLEFAIANNIALDHSLIVARSAADKTMGERLGIPTYT